MSTSFALKVYGRWVFVVDEREWVSCWSGWKSWLINFQLHFLSFSSPFLIIPKATSAAAIWRWVRQASTTTFEFSWAENWRGQFELLNFASLSTLRFSHFRHHSLAAQSREELSLSLIQDSRGKLFQFSTLHTGFVCARQRQTFSLCSSRNTSTISLIEVSSDWTTRLINVKITWPIITM